MINFRFHVVSLIAIFLALALGVVMGYGVLGQPTVDTLQGREQALFFPEADCSKNALGGVWYVGPEPGSAPQTQMDGIQLPLVNAAQK